MYRIREYDGKIQAWICKDNKANPYGEPKEWMTLKDAKAWVKRRTYGGMSFKYVIFEKHSDGIWSEVIGR